MDVTEIKSYLYSKIDDYSRRENQNKHLFQYIMYAYPFIFEGKTHWFLSHLFETLAYINKFVEGYSKITIDKIASIDKQNPAQISQVLGEVLVLFNLLKLDATDKNSVELEPVPYKGAKNPEFRMKIGDEWFAIEVKTPDLTPFNEIRHNGVQITSRLKKEEIEVLKENREIVFSKDLKIQDYLKSAEEKFIVYREKEQYKNDKTILVIVWDDFINECISTLVNPHSGLLTNKRFYKDSKFENVDAVITFRHLHHIKHLFYFGELLLYGPQDEPSENVFNLEEYPLTTGVYCKNVFSHKEIGFDFYKIAYPLSEKENPVNFVAEYHPTDFIDWTIALGVSGLSYCSEELRYKVINLFKKNREFKLNNSKITADLTTVSLKNILQNYQSEEKAFEKIKHIIEINEAVCLSNIVKIESDWDTINKLDTDIKKQFNKFKKTRLDKECLCKSKKRYHECCYHHLKYFKFTKYYIP